MSDAHEERNRRVERYLRGQADDETARQMEIDMLEDDDLFERVQTEDLLKRGFAEDERIASLDEDANQERSAFLPRLGWALAASFAAFAVTLSLYSLQLSERIETLQSPTIGLPVITLLEQRSALLPENGPPRSMATGSSGALIEIDVSGIENDRFTLTVNTDRRRYEWSAVKRDERGYVTLLLPPNATVQTILVRGRGNEILREYNFNRENE